MFLDIRQLLRSWMSTWHVPELPGLQYNHCVPVIWMFLNTKQLLNVPRYQTTSAFLNVNMTCSWTSRTSIQSLCPRNLNVPEYKTVPECSGYQTTSAFLNVNMTCSWTSRTSIQYLCPCNLNVPEYKTVPECSWISDNFCVPECQHDMFLNFSDFNTISVSL